MAIKELKPCPFCGSKHIDSHNLILEGYVMCATCRASICYRHSPKKEDGQKLAIKAWQTRWKGPEDAK